MVRNKCFCRTLVQGMDHLPGFRSWPRGMILVSALFLAAVFSGCGDNKSVTVPVTSSVQGIWEGTISLTSSTGDLVEASRIRLELVQQDFNFQGFLIKINPLAQGLGRAAVDTFLVTSGTVSADFVSFRATDPEGGSSVFEGELSGNSLSGVTRGTGYSGVWKAELVL
jgi:hypothetical protein